MKYETLKNFLSEQTAPRISMSFEEVAKTARVKLPQSAYRYPAWWENDRSHHVQAKAWLDAGYVTADVDIEGQTVVFVRADSRQTQPGVQAAPREFVHGEERKPGRHPLIGAMKGTFTIDPSWDLTKPAFDEEDMAEMEASLERKWTLLEEGRRHKSE